MTLTVLTPDVRDAVNDLARELLAYPEHWLAVFAFESAGTLDPQICNVYLPPSVTGGKPRQFAKRWSELTETERRHVVAIGLCQLTRVARGEIYRRTRRLYTVEALARMSAGEQLRGPIRDYLLPYAGRVGTLEDAYMAVFCPSAMGKPPEHGLYAAPTAAYRLNAGLDLDHDGKITKREAAAQVARFLPAVRKRLRELEGA